MIPESIVRLFFAAVFISVFSVGFYFRLKAYQQPDRFERMQNEGKIAFFILRFCGAVVWGVAFLFPWFPDLFSAVRFEPIPAIQIIGIVLLVFSIPMGISVFTNSGKILLIPRKHAKAINW